MKSCVGEWHRILLADGCKPAQAHSPAQQVSAFAVSGICEPTALAAGGRLTRPLAYPGHWLADRPRLAPASALRLTIVWQMPALLVVRCMFRVLAESLQFSQLVKLLMYR